MRLVTAVVCLVAVLVGVVGGLTAGYALWSQEAIDVATLNGELEKTRSWLLDEIAWSDERCDRLRAALTKAETELAQARRQLVRSREQEQTLGSAKRERLQAHETSEAPRRIPTR
jgi:hypothetical protein